MKLNAIALGIAGGLIWGLVVFLFSLSALYLNYGIEFVSALNPFYIGYSVSVKGALIGFLWGFLDAGIGLLIFGWLYNILNSLLTKSK